MELAIYIKDGKILDICGTKLRAKGDNSVLNESYIIIDIKSGSDICIGDTWDSQNKISLKDSPHRILEKSTEQEKLELLQEELEDIKARLKIVENK